METFSSMWQKIKSYGDRYFCSPDELGTEVIVSTNSEDTRLSTESRFQQLVKTIYRFESNETSLKVALDVLQKDWLLLHLDKSLSGVRNNTKELDEHNKYFESCIKDLLRLSLMYHPDKGIEDNEKQTLINITVNALRNIHNYVIRDDFFLKKECYILYRLYSPLPITMLSKDEEDVSKLVKISPVDGTSALFELNLLSDMEEGYLTEARNVFLTNSECIVMNLDMVLQFCMGKVIVNKIDLKTEMIRFNNIYKNYVHEYKKNWVEHLQGLYIRCGKSENLKLIKVAVDKLLKESQLQFRMLESKCYDIYPDETFVLPMLDYFTFINSYYRFTAQILTSLNTDIVTSKSHTDSKTSSNGERKLIFHVEELINCFIKDCKPLSTYLYGMANFDERQYEIISYFSTLHSMLRNRYKKKLTSFLRQQIEFDQIKKNIDDIKANVKHEKQLALDLEHKANFIRLVSSTFSKKLFSSDMNEDLKKKLFGKLDIIIKETVELFDKSNEDMCSSDTIQLLFDMIMEEMKGNSDEERVERCEWSDPSTTAVVSDPCTSDPSTTAVVSNGSNSDEERVERCKWSDPCTSDPSTTAVVSNGSNNVEENSIGFPVDGSSTMIQLPRIYLTDARKEMIEQMKSVMFKNIQ